MRDFRRFFFFGFKSKSEKWSPQPMKRMVECENGVKFTQETNMVQTKSHTTQQHKNNCEQ